jgi:uncharacterized protein
MNIATRSASIFFTLFCSVAASSVVAKEAVKSAPTKLPTITLSVGNQTIKAEIAADDPTRQQGLMFRTQMGKNDGMLFVFPQLGYHAMWMRNTLIPLSVAYMDDAGKIVSLHEMQPQNDTAHQAAGPVRYGLEMNTGWFKTHKVNVGDTIKGLEKAPAPK